MEVLTKHGFYGDSCTRCALSECRQPNTSPVYGHGNADAEFLILAETPTIEDQCTGALFTGPRGALLFELLSAAGINPHHTFRTTMVACPSYIIIPATEEQEERISYQDPQASHIATCAPRLHEIIYRVDPRVILCFGDLPFKALLSQKQRGGKNKTEDVQGSLYDLVLEGRGQKVRYPLLALLSLDKILKNPSAAKHAPLASTIKHLTRVNRLLTKLKENP